MRQVRQKPVSTADPSRVLLATALLAATTAVAQVPRSGNDPFAGLQDAVADLRDAKAPDPRWSAAVARLRDQAADLQEAAGGKPVDEQYASTLAIDARAMARAARNPSDPRSYPALRATSQDLDAKLSSLHQSLGLSGGSLGVLDVEITTVKDGKPVNGYLVRANCPGAPDADPPFKVFDNPSSPAKARMAPGLYVVVAKLHESDAPATSQYVEIDGRPGKPVAREVLLP